MRQIRTTNAACTIPVYKQLGNTNTLFLDTLALQSAVDSRVCHNINKTVFTKHDKAYENNFL